MSVRGHARATRVRENGSFGTWTSTAAGWRLLPLFIRMSQGIKTLNRQFGVGEGVGGLKGLGGPSESGENN